MPSASGPSMPPLRAASALLASLCAALLPTALHAQLATADDEPTPEIDAADAPPSTWTLPLAAGQSSVIYERFDGPATVPIAVAEYRDGAWRRPSADAPPARSFVGALQSPTAVQPAGQPLASMTLKRRGRGLTVTFPEPSSALVDPEGNPVDAYPVMEVVAAGWFTLAGESRPTAFVHGVEPGAYCCAFTLLARRAVDGPWTWRARSWGPYRNLALFDDLDHDGTVEWVARDEHFRADRWINAEGNFGPIGVWHFGPAGFSPVTRRFPAVVEADRRSLASVEDSNLALASWMAETRLLGRPVPTREVRARAVRMGAGEGTHETVDRWLRAVTALGTRYVAEHSPRR